MNQSLFRRLTSRKLILALTPTILVILKWAGTRTPPTPPEIYAALGGIIAGIAGIAHVDAQNIRQADNAAPTEKE